MHYFWLQTRLYLIHTNCGENTTKFRAGSDTILASCSLSAPQHPHGICGKHSVTQYWKKCFKPAIWHSRRLYGTSLRFCMSLFCILIYCLFVCIIKKDVPYLKRFVRGSAPRRPSVIPWLVDEGFVADKVVMKQIFLRVLRFSPVIVIPRILRIYSIISLQCHRL